MQVVRAGPDVDEDQRPEVDDAQAVGIDRPLGRLGQVVIHHAQERRGEEEAHRVVPVPPLHEGVLHAGIDRDPGLAQPLHRVVDGGEDGVAGKGENCRIGMQRPLAERKSRQPQVHRRQHKFQGDDQSHEEGHHTPQDGDHQKGADHGVVIDEFFQRP